MQQVIDFIVSWGEAVWVVMAESAPWLMIGFLAAGLLKTLLPSGALSRWIGARGFGSVTKAALIGAPLPLCSCGVLPVATGLHRDGASAGATTSFLISTPETSADSVVLTYALMGPWMALARPIAAIATALGAGAAVDRFAPRTDTDAGQTTDAGSQTAASSCCGDTAKPEPAAVAADCCSTTGEEGNAATAPRRPSFTRRIGSGIHYAAYELIDDLAFWLVIGIALAGLISAALPPNFLGAELGQGIGAMLIMLVVGIPLYICATASTPVAAALLVQGMAPGALLVFLLVGPATNIAAMLVYRKMLGWRALAIYLGIIAAAALGFGLALDALLAATGTTIAASLGHGAHIFPPIVHHVTAAILSGWLLYRLGIKLARRVRPAAPPAAPAEARAADPGGACVHCGQTAAACAC